ncbi:MAG: sulfotransferase domain-containing protein [Sinobacterium sp.]
MSILFELERTIRSYWEVPANFKSNNVILSSFPKSGNTWLRFLVANVLAKTSNHPLGPVDFHSIQNYAPEIRGNRKLKDAVYSEECCTFLKSHFAQIRGFENYPCVVIFRDPQKVLLSYAHYLSEEKGRVIENENFLKSWRYGAPAWVDFHKHWLKDEKALFLNYQDLVDSTQTAVTDLYRELGYEISDYVIEAATSASNRENMSNILEEKGDPNAKNPDYKFVRKLQDCERGLFSEDELDYLNTKCSSTYDELLKRAQ